MMQFDLIIVGAGIAGLGVLEQASSRGLKIALIEKGVCAQATSANSLRIMHGGLRYLQSLDFKRMRDSIQDQTKLLRDFPALVKPLACITPLTAFGLRSRLPCLLATSFYRLFAQMVCKESTRASVVDASYVAEHMKSALGIAPYGALLWYDALLLDPDLLAKSLVDQALARGATLIESSPVKQVSRSASGFTVELASGECFQTKQVVNAAGAGINSFNKIGIASNPLKISWSLGFNLVLKRNFLGDTALGIYSPQGRLFFVTPRAEQSALGTGYVSLRDGSSDTVVPEAALAKFMADFNQALPGINLRPEDILKVESGLLPEISKGKLLAKHYIWHDRGYCEIVSTKYTTFRSQALQAINILTGVN